MMELNLTRVDYLQVNIMLNGIVTILFSLDRHCTVLYNA